MKLLMHCSKGSRNGRRTRRRIPRARGRSRAKSVVDVAKARNDALAASVDDMLRLEAEDLVAIKVERTPTFFVNGKPLPTFGDQQLLDLVASEVQNR